MPQNDIELRIAQGWPPHGWQSAGVLLAVSGGADSVALLRAMRNLWAGPSGALAAAHFNHGWRGHEADADQQFVVDLCTDAGIPCRIGSAPLEQKVSPQEASARTARYQFLEEAAHSMGARYIVTAHTADDQAETILHRIVRGTGLAGLAGIPRIRVLPGELTLIRPMLHIRRSEVITYLRELGQSWREDRTNQDCDYTRARLRHNLLPLLERDYNPNAVDSLLRLGSLAHEAQQIIRASSAALYEQCVSVRDWATAEIRCAVLQGQPPYLAREILIELWRRQSWPLKSMGYDQWETVADLAQRQQTSSGNALLMLPGGIRAQRRGEQLTLTRLA